MTKQDGEGNGTARRDGAGADTRRDSAGTGMTALQRMLSDDREELPLEDLVSDGGFCGIFRTIGCVGDSMASGEFECHGADGQTQFPDFYAYSWGQFLARMAGSTAYNFSRGGMTAQWYCESYAEENGFWDPDKACQAYIVALGVNDLFNAHQPVGSLADVDDADWRNNAPTFAGYFAQILQRLREISPHARFFLVTIPRDGSEGPQGEIAPDGSRWAFGDAHAELMHRLAAHFTHTYVVDLRRYAPVHDAAFQRRFFMGGHMTPCGYLLEARLIASYIDYIIRHNPDDFRQAGLIGTPYYVPET